MNETTEYVLLIGIAVFVAVSNVFILLFFFRTLKRVKERIEKG